MKKILILFVMLLACVFAYEDVPLLIDTTALDIQVEKNNANLIQTQKVKKLQNIQEEKLELQKPKIKLDTKQIHQQRTLDYMNNKSGTMLPIF